MELSCLKMGLDLIQWIGLRENLQENPHIYWENPWFPVDFPLNQSID
jgi:hypothetical protein